MNDKCRNGTKGRTPPTTSPFHFQPELAALAAHAISPKAIGGRTSDRKKSANATSKTPMQKKVFATDARLSPVSGEAANGHLSPLRNIGRSG